MCKQPPGNHLPGGDVHRMVIACHWCAPHVATTNTVEQLPTLGAMINAVMYLTTPWCKWPQRWCKPQHHNVIVNTMVQLSPPWCNSQHRGAIANTVIRVQHPPNLAAMHKLCMKCGHTQVVRNVIIRNSWNCLTGNDVLNLKWCANAQSIAEKG